MRIGLDFDNTLVCYDAVFHRLAFERGLIDAGFPPSKRQIRDHIRVHNGDLAWQKLQALAYGPEIESAHLFDGVLRFIPRALDIGHQLVIVSHKTQHASYGSPPPDLHAAARRFLDAKLFAQLGATHRHQIDVYFEPTRRDKCNRIGSLGCDVFVDDLQETFDDPAFPPAVRKILFDPNRQCAGETLTAAHSWSEVCDDLFD